MSSEEFLASLPELKPRKASQSLKFTLRHLAKRAKGIATEGVAAARAAVQVEMQHYAPPKKEQAPAMPPLSLPSHDDRWTNGISPLTVLCLPPPHHRIGNPRRLGGDIDPPVNLPSLVASLKSCPKPLRRRLLPSRGKTKPSIFLP